MYEYHHMGIPTTEEKDGEVYFPKFKMWVSRSGEFGVQWHRFDSDCDLHSLIQTMPHAAFRVENMEEALKGKRVILEPSSLAEGYLIAFIEDGGAPIELIQTDFTEEESLLREKKDQSETESVTDD